MIRSLAGGSALLMLIACAQNRATDPTQEDTTTKPGAANASPLSASDAGSSVDVPNAIAVIDTMRPHFRSCYNRGLQIDRELSGSVMFTLQIGGDGAVASTTVKSLDGLTAAVTSCIADILKTAHFEAPPNGHATINVPVRFVNKRPPPQAGTTL